MPPSPEKIRHVDKGALLVSFARRVIAVCPKCGGPALVTNQSRLTVPFVATHARINCLCCSLQLIARDGEWLGPMTGVAKGRCPHCGFKWLKKEMRRRRVNNRATQWASVACSSCAKVTKIPIQWTQQRFGSPIDPALGLPLWLQVSCCGETLWAYNGEHLSKLRVYLEAGLRERTANKHWSMFSRLPQWMTAGKNREAVLSSINRLEKRLASVLKGSG
jgi:hypothetical protein